VLGLVGLAVPVQARLPRFVQVRCLFRFSGANTPERLLVSDPCSTASFTICYLELSYHPPRLLPLLSVCHLHETFAPTASTASTMSSPSSPTSDRLSNPSNLPQISTMAPRDRSRGRDVHIYDFKDPTTVLGGLILTNGVTNTNFYSMVEILVLFTSDFELRDEGDTQIEKNDEPLQPGRYYINAAGKFLYNHLVVLS
jgi:hypothetical protein